MATVNAVVLKHQKKQDGTWNVKICVNHKSNARYIETSAYVTKASLDTKGKLKQTYIDRCFSGQLSKYRDAIAMLGSRIDSMSSADLRDYLLTLDKKGEVIDLFSEIELRIAELKKENKIPQSYIYITVLNHLKEFTGTEKLNILKINPKFLTEFEKYLRQPKTISRRTRSGSYTKQISLKGVSTNGVINYMGYLRTLFGIVQKKYNDPLIDHFPIPRSPFDYYDFPTETIRKKRNLTVGRIRQIQQFQPTCFWETISKDMFLLSFYLCGINTKDIYVYLTDPNIRGNLEYARSKVKADRKDGGVTNVLIVDEAVEIIEKYASFIQSRYSNHLSLNQALWKGWKLISDKIGFKCTMYYARHSFSNIARQVCKFSKDDVSFALNHKYGLDITDVYIEPDWSVVHKVQLGVLKALKEADIDSGE
jgi:hypothetical protein